MRPSPRRTASQHHGTPERAASHPSGESRSAGSTRLADLSGASNTVLQRLVATGADPRAVRASAAAVGRLQRWKIETLEKNKPEDFKRLLAAMDGDKDETRRVQLSGLADFTDNAGQLSTLLEATSGDKKATTLLQVLKLTVGYSGLSALFTISPDPKVIAEVLALEPSPLERRPLIELSAKVKDVVVLKDMLNRMSGAQKCTDLLDAVDRAGGLEGLRALQPLTANLGVIVALLRKPGVGSGAVLQEFIPLAKDGETLLQLFDLADAKSIKFILSQATYTKGDYNAVKTALSQHIVTGAGGVGEGPVETVSTKPIRFTQDTCSKAGGGYSVQENIKSLKSNKDWHIPGGKIRVFQKKPTMDAWGADQTGHPKYLEDGMIYSLDNRRLYAYKQAARRIPKPEFVPDNVVKAERWKFTTANWGTSIKLV